MQRNGWGSWPLQDRRAPVICTFFRLFIDDTEYNRGRHPSKDGIFLLAGKSNLHPLTPNDPYRGRTAPLTSKVAFYIFIQQI